MLVHNTRSNDSWSNNAQFMHKLCLSLHAHKETRWGGYIPSHWKVQRFYWVNRAWFPSLQTIIINSFHQCTYSFFFLCGHYDPPNNENAHTVLPLQPYCLLQKLIYENIYNLHAFVLVVLQRTIRKFSYFCNFVMGI